MGGITLERKVSIDSWVEGLGGMERTKEITSRCWRWAMIIVRIVRRWSGLMTRNTRGIAFFPLRIDRNAMKGWRSDLCQPEWRAVTDQWVP
jgi:hypothetical protein